MNMDFFILMKHELSLMLIIFILLFLKIRSAEMNVDSLLNTINVLLLINFALCFVMNKTGELFSGMYHTNELLALEKNILNFGTLIISLQAYNWLRNHKHLLEFYMLLLSSVIGMFYMLSAGNFLMFYLGLELSTIPLAALANFDLEKNKSSEAAVKMILSSAFASAIMLFGISMIYGTTGTLSFDTMVNYLDGSNLQLLAFIFIFGGFAFKLSIVPFHLWTADVYEGAPVSITAFLSVISKAAMSFALITVIHNVFREFESMWYNMLFVSIVITITVGNIFAIRQDNIKRFLAFSSIAQVGYILLGLSSGTNLGASSAIYFLVIYVFSNLGAFGVIALVSAQTGKENISDFRSFYTNNKMLSWVMAISLFSLAGVPPTAGFFGKMFLVTSGASKGNYLLITIASLNMVVSLYYYLKIVKTMLVDKSEAPIEKINRCNHAYLAIAVCMIGVIVTGFYSGLLDYIINLFG